MGEGPFGEVKEAENSSQSDITSQEGQQAEHHGTKHDARDMHRLGKKQEFQVSWLWRSHQDEDTRADTDRRASIQRNFRYLTILGFTSTLMCTWEGVIA